MPTRILQLTHQLHNNTIKSVIVTPDKSIMLLPHCNVHALPVDPLRPRRVKMKIFNLQEPLSRDTGDQPINKYTTFNMEMSHTEEHQPFARENPNPCKLAPYGITHDFYMVDARNLSGGNPESSFFQSGNTDPRRHLCPSHQARRAPLATEHYGSPNIPSNLWSSEWFRWRGKFRWR